jgi:tRNA/rRNA methyltransferase
LPDQFHLDRIDVVLVSPRNPLNIGAAARAMANFGFSRLTVVAPYEPHWREARSAVGAETLLQSAKVAASLEEALAGATLALGTGMLTRRKPGLPAVALPTLAPLVDEELNRGGRVALVFGPEKRGLTGRDLSLCHRLVQIPTHPRQPSMNLGQAVAVCLYELATRLAPDFAAPEPDLSNTESTPESGPESGPDPFAPAPVSSQQSSASAPSADLERLADLIDQVMLAARYSPPAMREANRHDLRLLLRRLALSPPDIRRALGFFRRILRGLEK